MNSLLEKFEGKFVEPIFSVASVYLLVYLLVDQAVLFVF